MSIMETPLHVTASFEIQSVIRFLTAKNKTAVKIHQQISSVYGKDAISVQMARCWLTMSIEGRETVHDEERSGRSMATRQADPSLIHEAKNFDKYIYKKLQATMLPAETKDSEDTTEYLTYTSFSAYFFRFLKSKITRTEVLSLSSGTFFSSTFGAVIVAIRFLTVSGLAEVIGGTTFFAFLFGVSSLAFTIGFLTTRVTFSTTGIVVGSTTRVTEVSAEAGKDKDPLVTILLEIGLPLLGLPTGFLGCIDEPEGGRPLVGRRTGMGGGEGGGGVGGGGCCGGGV
ncbi:hypothetical protein J437_LFUL003632 [Ladona fulva]|uniref:Uncharacterized protein n=1 Tax=Ladona fulva TaxID=123851 RepID=A0A8K0JW19_LADFU|nr:hypothetical protein J437_LFUL003632 [Ladona fulva]